MKKILITGGSGFIGTNLIEFWKQRYEVLNLDWNAPINPKQNIYWKECDIMDRDTLFYYFNIFQPDAIVHLAARTDTDIYELDGDLNEYIQNHEGTNNVLGCINESPSIKRAIIASSMFVCKPGYIPQDDLDFSPFTLYGVSKKLTEQFTRDADLKVTWSIIRPQTIWGPWSLRYKRTLYKVLKNGLYFHPNKRDVHRAYGYIGNVVWQIDKIFKEPHNKVNAQVFYVGDRAINLMNWVKAVSLRLTNKSIRVIPQSMVKGIAITGDLLKALKISFPITSTRYNSMVEDYLTPIEKTYNALGTPPFSMQQGINEFADWLETYQLEEVDNATPKKIKAGLRYTVQT